MCNPVRKHLIHGATLILQNLIYLLTAKEIGGVGKYELSKLPGPAELGVSQWRQKSEKT